ncbi:LuxR family transcriptional regulator [Frankia sp. QA3]|uniref:helix-turn-helix transcriptional regulator n=1 Tax=Frankia sp. QA3 TaxID=710111 RepID=UPI000269C2B4|nr:LuxR family transcriptional regulator [Frankia sp. QA3]EIV91034.1 transcriptional regulator, luxR family [Frankia sp. QA3]
MNGLLERDGEIAILDGLLRDLECGMGRFAMIEAASGMGKSALLRHAGDRARERGFQVCSARGSELEREFTFGVVRQLFERVSADPWETENELYLGAAAPARTILTGAADGAGAAPSGFLLLNSLYWFLVNLSARQPVVLLIDDVQWIDRSSKGFLEFLAHRIEATPVASILASRTRPVAVGSPVESLLFSADTTLLEPRSLSAAGVTELVRRSLGAPADPVFCTSCHEVTAGNPFFLRELLRILAVAGTTPSAASVPAVRTAGPVAMRREVVGRLARLPPAATAVAGAVAILGDDSPLTMIAGQAGLRVDLASRMAHQLTSAGILACADPPAFVHDVIAEVVGSLLPRAAQSAAHDRAARMLADHGAEPARIASHLMRTDPAARTDRVDLLLAAAHDAHRQGSPATAAIYLRRARLEPPPPGIRAEVSRLLGVSETYDLALTAADEHLREAMALAADAAQRAVCAGDLARVRLAMGLPGEATDLFVEALDLLGSEPDGRGLATAVEAELIGIAPLDARRRGQVATWLASYQRRRDASTAVVAANLALDAAFDGSVEHAGDLAERALAGDLPPERSALWSAVMALIATDRLTAAERHLDRTTQVCLRRGLLISHALAHGFRARVALLRGDLRAADEHVRIGLTDLHPPNFALPILHAAQVNLLVEQGDLAGAQAALDAEDLGASPGTRSLLQMWLLGARIGLRAAQGRHDVVLAEALRWGELHQPWGGDRTCDEVPWRLLAATACARLGRRDQGRSLVAEHLRLAHDLGMARHIGVGLRVSALFEAPDTAAKLLHESVELLELSPARLELARSLEALGRILLDIGPARTGLEALTRGAELAARCHADRMTGRLHALLADNGRKVPRGLTQGLHTLTPAERSVSCLAADGHTNREIAEQLFLSEKTVEAHLSRTYRKVGVRSRTQLAAQLAAGEFACGPALSGPPKPSVLGQRGLR